MKLSLERVVIYKLTYFRAITVSSLRKSSSAAEEKKVQEQDSQTAVSEAELREQFGKLNEDVKQLKEKNDELLVSPFC